MQNIISTPPNCKQRLRAVVEIDAGELHVYPIADNDTDEKLILDALRFVREEFER